MNEETLVNPVTGESMTILESTPEVFRVRYSMGPRCSIAGSHFHPGKEHWVEVISGVMRLRIDGVHRILRAGESTTVPAGAHHFQWNPDDVETVAIEDLRPAGRAHDMFATVFGLARDGKSSSRGYPSPLFAAAIVAEFGDTLQPAPLGLRLLFRALAPLASALGYRRQLEKYWRAVPPAPSVVGAATA